MQTSARTQNNEGPPRTNRNWLQKRKTIKSRLKFIHKRQKNSQRAREWTTSFKKKSSQQEDAHCRFPRMNSGKILGKHSWSRLFSIEFSLDFFHPWFIHFVGDHAARLSLFLLLSSSIQLLGQQHRVALPHEPLTRDHHPFLRISFEKRLHQTRY